MAKPEQKPDTTADQVEVTVKSTNHRHAGKPVKPGDKVMVHSSKVRGLIKAGVIEG